MVTSNGATSGSAVVVGRLGARTAPAANAQLRAYDPVPVGGHFSLRWSAPIGTALEVLDAGGRQLARLRRNPRRPRARVLVAGQCADVGRAAVVPGHRRRAVGDQVGRLHRAPGDRRQRVQLDEPGLHDGYLDAGLPDSLAAGDTISVPMTFTPTQTGLASTTLRANTSNGPVDVAFECPRRGRRPRQLVASPAQLSLGGTTAGGSRLSGSVTLTNAGATPLTVTGTDVPAGGFAVRGARGTTCRHDDPGGHVGFGERQVHAGAAPRSQRDTRTTSPSLERSVTRPSLSRPSSPSRRTSTITPMSIDLGNVPLGASTDAMFTLDNTGGLGASFVRSKPPAKNVGFVATTALPEGTTLPPAQP